MLSGLVFMQTDGKGNITAVWDDDVDSDDLDDIMDEKAYDDVPAYAYSDPMTSLYYFGGTDNEDADGSLKTGNVTVNLDGNSYNFLFRKAGGKEGKGYGMSGIEKEKYIYKYGMRLKAGNDDKYKVIEVVNGSGNLDVGAAGVKVMKIDSVKLRNEADPLGQNKKGDSVEGLVTEGKTWPSKYYLIGASGNICKRKTAAKDGNDWFFYVNKDKNIVAYTNNKDLKDDPREGYVLSVDFDHGGPNSNSWDKWTGVDTSFPSASDLY